MIHRFVNSSLVCKRSYSDTLLSSKAHLLLLDSLYHSSRELVVDSSLYKDSVCRDTGLTGIPELGCNTSICSIVDLCIVKDNERAVAAKFKRELLDSRRALLHKDLADPC